jgi:alpha,alpha-trehalase
LGSKINTVRESLKTIKRSDLLSIYKPISYYGIVGDMKSCALVGVDGSIDWMCIPRFDSPSVFAAILDLEKGGRFLVCPTADIFESLQAYEPMTNILTTKFSANSSSVTLTDFMPCFTIERSLVSLGELHRLIECTKGEMEMEARFEPRPGFGSHVPNLEWKEGIGYSYLSRSDDQNQGLTLLTSLKFDEISKGTITSRFYLKEGQKLELVIRSPTMIRHHSADPNSKIKLEETREFWKRWIGRCHFSGKWRDQVLRSALTLKLLVYSPTGAIVAAPTTSLPEEIGGLRNWDYRFSWIRDSSFVLWAFHSLGFNEEANGYLDWLLGAFCLTIGNLQPMLGITGDRDLTEKFLDNMSGYKGSSPVRLGNDAWKQFQLDLYGIFIDALYFSHKHGRGVDKKVFNYLIKPLISALSESWTKPDCGIWEVRSKDEHFVYSKMWAWVGVDRALKIAEANHYTEVVQDWSALREQIRENIISNGYDQGIQSFVRSYGSKELDAANLLMPQVRFLPAQDSKMSSTIEATVKKLLTKDGFVYRYLTEDGLPGKEGAFLICSFWLVNCLTLAGRLAEAEKLMDSVAQYSNHLGLFSEEIDPNSGDMLGNFPQAFTHMGFITAAVNLSTAIEKSKDAAQTNKTF